MRLDRIEREEEVLVDVVDCDSDPELNDTHVSGKTVDISEAGMKVSMSVTVPENTKLSLRLDLDDQVLRLDGQVRWAKKDGQYFVGVMLDEDSPDLDQWRQIFELGLEQ